MSKLDAILKIMTLTASSALLIGGASGAKAADMISDSYYQEQRAPAPKVRRAHATVYRTVTRPYSECGLLRIDYRRPYVPHTEIVEVCHKPIEWRPGSN